MEQQKFRTSFGLIRRLLIVFTTGFPDQNFLGAFYIPFLLQSISPKFRKNLALNLLFISPHYYGTLPPNIRRQDFIEAEHQGMLLSRESMIERKVKPHLNQNMIVLDHGCGPGYLASAVSRYCNRVIAVDISSGVIACAKAINGKPNIEYITESGTHLSQVENSSIDLIYSFAVMQHVTDDVCQQILQEFFRVLKPQGKIICEFVVDLQNTGNASINKQILNPFVKKIKERYILRVLGRPFPKIEKFILDSGLEIAKVTANKFDPGEEKSKDAELYYTFVLTKP
ncbi:class I SAM-dependent methyltransferase [Calothrix sp. UHCC 0171]|uniref:class I SAM-dependent methyltransferase n=1 Tax=Calothrix sp. UHCC 0171 TaxID=3110245 RepID=UPI002B220994|nr:class I SAM-dependent methyltransferase [Calothrix sp. UHCC 0171]MEA5573569.1 class I SAM-dependent methyltransferase [Calothrix sp. UHCC 0171]